MLEMLILRRMNHRLCHGILRQGVHAQQETHHSRVDCSGWISQFSPFTKGKLKEAISSGAIPYFQSQLSAQLRDLHL